MQMQVEWNISEEIRKEYFIYYHNLQSTFLSSVITLSVPFKVKTDSSKYKTVSAAYELVGRLVKVFL